LFFSLAQGRKTRIPFDFDFPKNNKQRMNPAHLMPDQPISQIVGPQYNTFWKAVKSNLARRKIFE